MCFRKRKPELSKRPIRIKIQIIIWQWELKMKTSRLLGARENAATLSRLYFSLCIWLVERMARVSWTNHKTTFGNTKTLKSGRITFDTQLKIGPKMIMSIRAIYNFLLSVDGDLGLHWICFTSLCDWSRKQRSPFQPISWKTETNCELIHSHFLALQEFC